MSTGASSYRQQAEHELETVPDGYLPYVIQMLRSLHQSVRLKPARESFLAGWQEARRGELHRVNSLWNDIYSE